MNILFCSAGRRVELLKDFRKSLSEGSRMIATDMSIYAPAIYMADAHYLVPSIYDESYLPTILEICRKEKIDAITTLIDPEIGILAKNRKAFEVLGITVLAPYEETAELCFDKYKMFLYLQEKGIPTPYTCGSFDEAREAVESGRLTLPVFVKPRTGSGSVGARRVETLEELRQAWNVEPKLIAQELMEGVDMDADVYVDTLSHQPVSIFAKRKLETKIGGASKTVSFRDEKLERFLLEALADLQFNGPIDVDLFCRDGEYYLSEINPRFGGAYLHAHGAGVDFVKLIENNMHGVANEPCFGNYEENLVMMMYDSVVIEKIEK